MRTALVVNAFAIALIACSSGGTTTAPSDAMTEEGGICPTPRAICGGLCVDITSSTDHCGRCNAPCAAGIACSAGVCGAAPCAPGESSCFANECRDLSSDRDNCGACGNRCEPTAACADGGCVNIPTDGLRIWLRADSLAGLASGGAVPAWPDRSGHGNDATQSDPSKRPKVVSSSIGGRRAVRYDGVDDALTFRSTAKLDFVEIFIVYRLEAGAAPSAGRAAYYPLALGGTSKEPGTFVGIETQNAESGSSANVLDVFAGSGNDMRATLTGISAFGQPKLVSIFAGSAISGTRVKVNGVRADTYITGTNVELNVSIGASGGDGWGGIGGNSTHVMKGDISEALVYGRALYPSEALAVESYLNTKYKVY